MIEFFGAPATGSGRPYSAATRAGGFVFVQLVPQGADADVEQLRGVSAVAFAFFQRRQDVELFKIRKLG